MRIRYKNYSVEVDLRNCIDRHSLVGQNIIKAFIRLLKKQELKDNNFKLLCEENKKLVQEIKQLKEQNNG